jgi:RNA polymerase sigma factor (sigma-70 family)
MTDHESALLQQFAGAGDANAFAEIVRRYAALVYGTCLRVLADGDKAADATQETFFQLTKNAGRIQGSLGAWLHRVAVRKAVDFIRTDSARRHRERKYADAQAGEAQTWHEVAPHVDEALDQLDGRTRELLVRHFLEGRSMTDLAEESGVSRPTVSRQIDSGLAMVRAHLQRRGVLVTAAGLSVLLAENVARSAPEVLLRQLGKMTLLAAETAGAAGSGASSSAVLTGGVLAAANAKILTAVVAVVVIGAGAVAYKSFSPEPEEIVSPPPAGRDNRGPDSGLVRTQTQEIPLVIESQTVEQQSSEAPVAPDATPSTQPAPVSEAADVGAVAPVDQTASTGDFRLDLSSPEATVRSFTKAIVSGDAASVMACMLPGGTDHEDMQAILAAGPDDPQQGSQYQMKLLLQSLDADAEMPVIATEPTERGTSVTWQVTFKKDMTEKGHTFRAGDTFELDATLRKSGDSWLIDGI